MYRSSAEKRKLFHNKKGGKAIIISDLKFSFSGSIPANGIILMNLHCTGFVTRTFALAPHCTSPHLSASSGQRPPRSGAVWSTRLYHPFAKRTGLCPGVRLDKVQAGEYIIYLCICEAVAKDPAPPEQSPPRSGAKRCEAVRSGAKRCEAVRSGEKRRTKSSAFAPAPPLRGWTQMTSALRRGTPST